MNTVPRTLAPLVQVLISVSQWEGENLDGFGRTRESGTDLPPERPLKETGRSEQTAHDSTWVLSDWTSTV